MARSTPTPTPTETPTPTPTPTPVLAPTLTATPVVEEAPPSTAVEATETPEATTAAPEVAAVTTASPASLANATAIPEASTAGDVASAAFVCTAGQLATLAALRDGNAYLWATCSSDGGDAGYVFPINGELAYAQMVAMSRSSACQVYFLAVLLVEASECQVAGVYVRSTAEAILALSLEADSYPAESQVDAAIAARITKYTSSSLPPALPLDWMMPSASELQQQLGMDLLINADLQIIGTAYLGSDDGEHKASSGASALSPASSDVSPSGGACLATSASWGAAIAALAAAATVAS